MAIADSKSRVTITMDNGVLDRLDAYCKRSGMSRSQYISYSVAHQLEIEERVTGGVLDAAQKLMTSMAAAGFDLEGLAAKVDAK